MLTTLHDICTLLCLLSISLPSTCSPLSGAGCNDCSLSSLQLPVIQIVSPTCTLAYLQVLATSRGDYSGPAEAIGAEFFADIDDFAEEHPDVVILATSILSTAAVLKSLPIARFRRSTLFVDVLSVKEFPKQLLLDRLPRQVGLGFRVATLAPLSVMCCPGGPGACVRALWRICCAFFLIQAGHLMPLISIKSCQQACVSVG